MDSEKLKNIPLKELYLYYNNIDKIKEPDRAKMVLDLIKEKERNPELNEPRLAARHSRLGAILIDMLVFVPFVVFFIFQTDIIEQRDAWQNNPAFTLINIVAGQLIFLLFNSWLLFKRGQTIGKWVLNIKITNVDNSRTPFPKIYGLRYLLNTIISAIPLIGIIYSFADVLFIFREDRRCLHDLIAGTKVVEL